MEIVARLDKPYTMEEHDEFIMNYGQNCHGTFPESYEIRETDSCIMAWGYTEAEKRAQEAEATANITLKRGEVFEALINARMLDEAGVREMIQREMPEVTIEEKKAKMKALNSLANATEFHRNHELVNEIGTELEITQDNLDNFFKTKDYHYLEESAQPGSAEYDQEEDEQDEPEPDEE